MDFCLNQTCVWWARIGPDGSGGWIYDDPEELSCRWQDTNERYVDANGEERISRSKIYLGQDVKVGDYLWLGELTSSLTSADNPANIPTAYPVRRFDKIPDLEATEFLRRSWL